MLGNLFYIVIFTTMAGSLFTFFTLFLRKVLGIPSPLWFGVCGIAFYLIPLIVPYVKLIPPEETMWLSGYRVACLVWLGGAVLFLSCYAVRGIFAHRALQRCTPCEEKRIRRIYKQCAEKLAMRRAPALLFGALEEPACVTGAVRPAIILNREIAVELTEQELEAVFSHELVHVKRGHLFFKLCFDAVSAVHWWNPFVWIAKNDFSIGCEMDCDTAALHVLNGDVDETAYASAMLRLLELSSARRRRACTGRGALDFLLAKQRIGFILKRPSRARRAAAAVLLSAFLLLTAAVSFAVSRSYFYPYPANRSGTEYISSDLQG